jgi:demethylmenaquinone methyltransferase/2-methoxy-6-polyprenyl-1,4-benzoquinol methylase
MTSTREENVAIDFFGREGARKYEFSRIWGNELHAVFAEVAPYYDAASDVASLGLCTRWRRRFISGIDLKPGDRVLDVCAGTNAVGIELLLKQPAASVCAMDRSKAMQDVGQRLTRRQGFNIESVIGDAHHLPFPDDSFDVATLQYASRHLSIVDVFAEVRRVLKPGGCFYHCDMLRPESRIVQGLYSAYLKACVSATAVIFRSSPATRDLRDYFVKAVQMFYSPAELTELLEHAGFSRVSAQVAPGGIMAIHGAYKM